MASDVYALAPEISTNRHVAIPAVVLLNITLDLWTAWLMMVIHGPYAEGNPLVRYVYLHGYAEYVVFTVGLVFVVSTMFYLIHEEFWNRWYMPVVIEVWLVIGLVAVVANTLRVIGLV